VKFEFVATSNWYPVAPEVAFQVTSIEFAVVLTVVGALVAIATGLTVTVIGADTKIQPFEFRVAVYVVFAVGETLKGLFVPTVDVPFDQLYELIAGIPVPV